MYLKELSSAHVQTMSKIFLKLSLKFYQAFSSWFYHSVTIINGKQNIELGSK